MKIVRSVGNLAGGGAKRSFALISVLVLYYGSAAAVESPSLPSSSYGVTLLANSGLQVRDDSPGYYDASGVYSYSETGVYDYDPAEPQATKLTFFLSAVAEPGAVAVNVSEGCQFYIICIDAFDAVGYLSFASAATNYYAEVIGPPTPNLIPLDISYTSSDYGIGLGAGGSTLIAADFAYTSAYGEVQNGQGILTGQVYADETAVEVSLYAEAVTVDGQGGASVDPYIYIDPSFATTDSDYLTDYSIIVSPSVPNSDAVTEPASWVFLMFGFGAMGSKLRRQQFRRSYRLRIY